MADTSPGFSTKTVNRQPAELLIAILLLYALTGNILLPGLNFDAIGPVFGGTFNFELSRLSILALGATPILSVYSLIELLKLIIGPFGRWEEKSADNAERLRLIGHALSLIAAAVQGYGIAIALQRTDIVDPAIFGSTLGLIASFVGMTAILLWFMDKARFPMLGTGLWFLVAAEVIAGIPSTLTSMLGMMRGGMVPMQVMIVPLLFIVLAVAMTVFAVRLLLSLPLAARKGDTAPLSVLLWPPLVAQIAASYVILIPAYLLQTFQQYDAVRILISVLTAILIPLLTMGYARRLGLDRLPNNKAILTAIIAIQLVIAFGAEVIIAATGWPYAMGGWQIMVLVAVSITLFRTPGPGAAISSSDRPARTL